MTWHRGFVVCPDHSSAHILKFLEKESNVGRMVAINGETAFAFTGRDVPDLEQYAAMVIGVDHGATNYFNEMRGEFSPQHLVPRLGLTVGLVVERDSIAMKSNEVRKHLKQLGRPSDDGKEDGLVGFRWDLEFKFGDRGIHAAIRSLNEIEEALIQAHEPYRIATFEGRFGIVHGDLGEVGDVCGDPMAIVVIKWLGQTGDINEVAANDSEFVVNGDDVPELELFME